MPSTPSLPVLMKAFLTYDMVQFVSLRWRKFTIGFPSHHEVRSHAYHAYQTYNQFKGVYHLQSYMKTCLFELMAADLVFLKKFDITMKFVQSEDPADFAAAIDEKTKGIYVESIGNPKNTVAPLPELAKVRPDSFLQLHR